MGHEVRVLLLLADVPGARATVAFGGVRGFPDVLPVVVVTRVRHMAT
jgi:hypothetical protein